MLTITLSYLLCQFRNSLFLLDSEMSEFNLAGFI